MAPLKEKSGGSCGDLWFFFVLFGFCVEGMTNMNNKRNDEDEEMRRKKITW